MLRGSGKKAAETLGVHPSTVSRNKERGDVATATQIATHEIRTELTTNAINRYDVGRPDSDSRGHESR